jgi:uncharacterized membrane protein HdeD (DUF308 family)
MDLLTAIGHVVTFAFASGINLYATIAVLGLCSRYNVVPLPDQFQAFDNPIVIGIAVTLFVVEFVADKIPWVDSVWDAVHTVVRPVGGALIAVTALDSQSNAMDLAAALLGGSVALTTHLAKTGTRAAVNTSPEPFSNWILSLVEDVFAIAFSYVALQHPIAALAVAVALLALIIVFASVLVRAIKRRFRGSAGPDGPDVASGVRIKA